MSWRVTITGAIFLLFAVLLATFGIALKDKFPWLPVMMIGANIVVILTGWKTILDMVQTTKTLQKVESDLEKQRLEIENLRLEIEDKKKTAQKQDAYIEVATFAHVTEYAARLRNVTPPIIAILTASLLYGLSAFLGEWEPVLETKRERTVEKTQLAQVQRDLQKARYMTERGQTPLTNILTDTADREVKDNDAAEREHLRAELTYTKAVLAQTRAELARVLRREDFLAHSNNVHLTKALSAQVVELNNQLQARDKLLEQLEANAEDVAAEKAQQVGVLEKINDKLREQTEQLKLLQAENYVLERKLRITENELNSAKAALQIEKHLKDLPASPPPPPKNEPQ